MHSAVGKKAVLQPKYVLAFFSLLTLGAALFEMLLPIFWLDADSSFTLAKEGWRLFFAHLVHLNFYHALLNISGLWLCFALCPEIFNRFLPFKVFVLALGISLCLWWLSPEMMPYAGFSAVLYGLFVLGLLPKAYKQDKEALFALVCLVAWMLWQLLVAPLDAEEQLIGGEVASVAHLYGCVLALILLFFSWTEKKLWRIMRG